MRFAFSFLIGLACAAFPAEARELVVAEGGKAALQIVIPDRAAAPERFAAGELARYIEAMTGARLSVAAESKAAGKPGIYVGGTVSSRKAGVVVKSRYAEDDAYRLQSDGRNLYAVGACPRGSLFAAYDLLRMAGCRFFAPGYKFYRGFHETVPRLARLAFPAELKSSFAPAFKLRGEYPEHSYNCEPDDVVALLDWAAKNRLNLVAARQNEFSDAWYHALEPEATKRGLLLAAGGHGYERFLPRDRYFREHPDWYAQVNGRRSDRYFDQICTSNPAALAEFRKNLADFVRRYPKIHYLSAMANDSPRWCECDRCKAQKLTPRQTLERMTRLISDVVWQTNPKMKIEMTALEYFGVPAGEYITVPHPNVIYRSGVLRRCLRHAWNDPACEQNRPQYEAAVAVTRKIKAAGGEIVWTSRYSSFREQSIPGILYPDQMRAELQDLRGLGGAGVLYNYSTAPDWIPYELKHLLYAALLFDPAQPVGPYMDAYYQERFPGSPAEVKSFYTNLRAAIERYDNPGGGYTRQTAFGVYPQEHLADAERELAAAQESMDRARKINPSRDEKQLLFLLGQSLKYARMRVEIDGLAQAHQTDKARALTAQMMELIQAWEGRGIFYDSSFLRHGTEYRFSEPPDGLGYKKRPWNWIRVYEYEDYGPGQAGRRRKGIEQ